MGRKHCGKNSPDDSFLIQASSTVILWKSDGTGTKGGFSFSWESVDSEIEVNSGAIKNVDEFHAHMKVIFYHYRISNISFLAFYQSAQLPDGIEKTKDHASL